MSNIKMRRQRPINLRLYIITLRCDYSLIYFSVILKEFLLGRVITGRKDIKKKNIDCWHSKHHWLPLDFGCWWIFWLQIGRSAPEKEGNWEQGSKMGLSFKLDFKNPYTVLGQGSKAWDSHCEMGWVPIAFLIVYLQSTFQI